MKGVRLFLFVICIYLGCISDVRAQEPSPCLAGRCYALVVANSDYTQPGWRKLDNPRRDQGLVAEALRSIPFKVTETADVSPKQLLKQIDDLAVEIKKNGSLDDAIILIYVAGHGQAVAGENLLIMPRADGEGNDKLELDELLSKLGGLEVGRVLLFIDACRNSADVNGTQSGTITRGASARSNSGFAPITPDLVPRRVYITFSTQFGSTASDGPKSGFSPFAVAFREHITSTEPFQVVLRDIARTTAVTASVLGLMPQRPQSYYGSSQGQIEQLDVFSLVSERKEQSSKSPPLTIESATQMLVDLAKSDPLEDLGQGEALRFLIGQGRSIAGLTLDGLTFKGLNLRGLRAREANFRLSDLSGTDLRGSDFSQAVLIASNLEGTNLSDARLAGANLKIAQARAINLSGADLSGTQLTGADLRGANLRGANLSGAVAVLADLRDADFTDANVQGLVLLASDLRGANFDRVRGNYLDLHSALIDEKAFNSLPKDTACALQDDEVSLGAKLTRRKLESNDLTVLWELPYSSGIRLPNYGFRFWKACKMDEIPQNASEFSPYRKTENWPRNVIYFNANVGLEFEQGAFSAKQESKLIALIQSLSERGKTIAEGLDSSIHFPFQQREQILLQSIRLGYSGLNRSTRASIILTNYTGLPGNWSSRLLAARDPAKRKELIDDHPWELRVKEHPISRFQFEYELNEMGISPEQLDGTKPMLPPELLFNGIAPNDYSLTVALEMLQHDGRVAPLPAPIKAWQLPSKSRRKNREYPRQPPKTPIERVDGYGFERNFVVQSFDDWRLEQASIVAAKEHKTNQQALEVIDSFARNMNISKEFNFLISQGIFFAVKIKSDELKARENEIVLLNGTLISLHTLPWTKNEKNEAEQRPWASENVDGLRQMGVVTEPKITLIPVKN